MEESKVVSGGMTRSVPGYREKCVTDKIAAQSTSWCAGLVDF